MDQTRPTTRRDPRITLPPATAWVEFEGGGADARRLRCDVVTISTTGLAFVLDFDPGIDAGTLLTPAIVSVDGQTARGDLYVRYSRPLEVSRIEVGCLFYSATLDDSTGWMQFVERRSSDGASPSPRLALRCSNCHSTVSVCVMERSSHHCPHCNQKYVFGKQYRLATYERVHRRACGKALELGIDLPSAVSIVMKLLTVSDVRDILDDAPPADPAAVEPGKSKDLWFDKGFLPAIEAGTLTELQASQRGVRESFAKKLVARHQISLEDAYAVADNRTSLLSLLREREAGEPITAIEVPASSSSRVVATAALSAIALMLGIGMIRQLDDLVNAPAAETGAPRTASAARPAATEPPSLPGPTAAPDLAELPVESYARVTTNALGEILFVEATDPANVLLAFCKSHGPFRRLEPIDVVPTDPPSDAARIGLLRDLDEVEGFRVVVIRRDLRTRLWYVGNVGNPDARVSMSPAPRWLERAADDAS